MKYGLTISVIALAMAVSAGAHPALTAGTSDMERMAVADTLYIPEDESEIGNDTIGKTRENKATGLDAMKELLGKRYLEDGETFTKKWSDHLFLQAGFGTEMIVPPGEYYHFDPLTTFHIGVGKQFNRLHSARLTLNGGFGFQRDKDLFFYKAGMKVDHLFGLSSYFSGYNPSRLLDLSTILGVGAQYAKLGKDGRSGTAFEAHAGLQLRFFTGPQGYINMEPYFGFGTDQTDLSESRNWRKVDMFYGANINFIYYINNNLSKESRARLLGRTSEDNRLNADSVPQSWRQPWFFEYANGLSFVDSPTLGTTETMGSNVTLSAGRWLSSVIGLRLSAYSASGKWLKTIIPELPSPYHPEYQRHYNTVHFGGRVEALINPLGFDPYYDWDRTFGGYVFGGIGMGRQLKYQNGVHLACRTESYSAGVHLWAAISSGLQFFIEPRFDHYVYKIPYSNVDWNKRYSDNCYSVNAGFTVTTRSKRFRSQDIYDGDGNDKRIVVGLGAGTSLMQTKGGYDNVSGGMPYNFGGFAEYHFNAVSAARLSFEYASMAVTGMTDFIDYNMTNLGDGYTPIDRQGLWKHRYFMGLASLSYLVDLTTLCDGYRSDRLFELSFYAGPTMTLLFGETASLDQNERLQEDHEVRQKEEAKASTKFGLHGGVKLTANILPNISLFLSPTVYLTGNLHLEGIEQLKVTHIETFNIGVQYRF
ncbi:MAG: hypothetical protein ACI4TW_02210 [Prevotella sp.]